jgi:hypothetical protein
LALVPGLGPDAVRLAGERLDLGGRQDSLQCLSESSPGADAGPALLAALEIDKAPRYQLFPKLGVTSRAALRDALAARPAGSKSNN